MAKINLEEIIRTALLVPMGKKGHPKAELSDDCRWGLPLLVWGSPGIGKSDKIASAADAVSLALGVIFPATRAPEDFSGAPVVLNGKMSIECIIGSVRDLCEKGKGVLFIDEISCAVPAVQGALLGLILDRRVGDVVLPPGVRVLSAANPPDEAAGGWELAPPTANRFAHVIAPTPTAKEFIDFLNDVETEKEDISAGEATVRDKWTAAWNKTVALVSGFHSVGGSPLYDLPKPGNPSRGRAWASPRSWEMTTRAVATCYALDTPNLIPTFVRACAGEAADKAFAEWLNKANLPDPKKMCLTGWTPESNRLDINVAAVSSMVGFVLSIKNKKEKEEMAIGAWRILGSLAEAGQLDIAGPNVKRLVNGGLGLHSGNKELAALVTPIISRINATGADKYLKSK